MISLDMAMTKLQSKAFIDPNIFESDFIEALDVLRYTSVYDTNIHNDIFIEDIGLSINVNNVIVNEYFRLMKKEDD